MARRRRVTFLKPENVNDLGNGRSIEELRNQLKKIQRLHNKLYKVGASPLAQAITAQAVHTLRWAINAESVFNFQPPAIRELEKYGLIKQCLHKDQNHEFVTAILYKEIITNQ